MTAQAAFAEKRALTIVAQGLLDERARPAASSEIIQLAVTTSRSVKPAAPPRSAFRGSLHNRPACTPPSSRPDAGGRSAGERPHFAGSTEDIVGLSFPATKHPLHLRSPEDRLEAGLEEVT